MPARHPAVPEAVREAAGGASAPSRVAPRPSGKALVLQELPGKDVVQLYDRRVAGPPLTGQAQVRLQEVMVAREKDIAEKVQWLADIEEIKQLKARYAAACDDDYDPDAIAELFTEDAVWDGGMMGRARTREGIRRFFANASNVVAFAVHGLSNPLIEVQGDRATGRWYLHQPMTMRGTNECFWFCACYEDEYVRTPDGWKFRHVRVMERAFTPYEEGFGKQLLAEFPTRQAD